MISAKMPSVAYARMMKAGAAGEAVMVGSGAFGAGSSTAGGRGVAEAEQAVNKTANKLRLAEKRNISPKCEIETLGERSHTFGHDRVQIHIFIFQNGLSDQAQFLAELMFNPPPEWNGTIGARGGDQLHHHRAQGMIGRDQLIE